MVHASQNLLASEAQLYLSCKYHPIKGHPREAPLRVGLRESVAKWVYKDEEMYD